MWKTAALLACALVTPAFADMYQDGSNAKQPEAINNIGKIAGNYYAPAYGACTWDATHDVGPCVIAALAAAAAAGGGTVTIPIGTYGLATKISFPTATAVRLQCQIGKAVDGEVRAATVFRWIGVAGGRMAEVKTATQRLYGPELNYCGFDGNKLAADGLHIENVWKGHFDNLTFYGGFTGGNVVNLTVETTTGGGTQNNTLDDLYIDNNWVDGTQSNAYTSNGLRLGAYWTSTQGYMNAAINFARNVYIATGTASTGILCVGCDNNQISGRVFGSVDLSIGHTGSVYYPANGNRFGPYFYYTSMTVRGETSFPGCKAASGCTYANYAILDLTNGVQQPTIEPGAEIQLDGSYGTLHNYSAYGGLQPGFVIAQQYSILPTCLANARINASNANTYLCNSSNSALAVFDSIGGDRFYQRMVGAPGAQNYQFDIQAGSGTYEFVPRVQLDNGAVPGAFHVGDIGSFQLPFAGLWAGAWGSSNGTHTWHLDLGLTAGSADGDAVLRHDGQIVATFGANGVSTFKYLAATPASPTGTTGCAAGMMTSDVGFLYVCTATNTWKRVALTAF